MGDSLMTKIRLVSTTNKNFKYMEGTVTEEDYFKIGTVVWFNNFHTSNIQNIAYTYLKDEIIIEVSTLNSIYKFSLVKESK